MKTTPTQAISDLASGLEESVASMTPLLRCHELASASQAASALEHAVAVSRGRAVRALVDEIGATAAAKELGVSRNRVYVMMRLADEG
jgi:hypothetical protein